MFTEWGLLMVFTMIIKNPIKTGFYLGLGFTAEKIVVPTAITTIVGGVALAKGLPNEMKPRTATSDPYEPNSILRIGLITSVKNDT